MTELMVLRELDEEERKEQNRRDGRALIEATFLRDLADVERIVAPNLSIVTFVGPLWIKGTCLHKMTALHAAALTRKHEAVQFLVDHGAIVDATDNHGHTALSYAARAGDFNIMGCLLNYDADVNAPHGKTSLLVATEGS